LKNNIIDHGGLVPALLGLDKSAHQQTPGTATEWVGVQEAASFLGVKKSWLYNSGDKYGVPCTKLGNLRRYNLDELDAYMRSQSNVTLTTTRTGSCI